MQLVEIFRAKIIDVSKNTLTIVSSGTSDKVVALLDMLRPFGIREIVRTGTIAIERGGRVIGSENGE